MTPTAPTPEDVRRAVNTLGPPGTPVTTPEVAERFDCTQRTIYNRLDSLVDGGDLRTKKVGANSRVWWQPVGSPTQYSGSTRGQEGIRSHPVFESEMLGVIVWKLDVTSEDAADLVIDDANEAFLEMVGFQRDAALGMSWRDLTPEAFHPESERHVGEVEANGTGAPYEKQYYRADGSRWWGLFTSQQLDDDRKVEFVIDITERKEGDVERRESEAALKRLNVAIQGLIDADTAVIADSVAPIAREVLDVEYASLWRYDETVGEIERTAVEAGADVYVDADALPSEVHDRIWQAFVGADLDVGTDLDFSSDGSSPLRSHAFAPLGTHGVVCLGSTSVDTFDEQTVALVEATAASVETAWDRAEGAETLQRRNEELTALNRINTLIRRIDRALVAADTRGEIDDAVCEGLADSDLFEFAWIGERDPTTDLVEPRAWAGVDSGYLEGLSIPVEDGATGRDPIGRAIRTGSVQVVADIATEGDFAPGREATLERGARSVVCIPLVYGDAVYGVLAVYADHPLSDADDRNRDVLSELGDTIAHTINARETRATLQTDSVVELTLGFEGADTPLCRLARDAACSILYHGFVPRSDGQADVFFVASGISPAELRDRAEHLLAFDDLRSLTDRDDGTLFRARVSAPTLAAQVTGAGAVVRSMVFDNGVATVVLDVPHTAAVREFLERIRHAHPEVELRARHSRERPLKTRQTFVAALDEQLTDRQREVLQTAYLSGFFEVPRVSNGQDITELLGISQPTFSEHLRGAQRGLCAVLFGGQAASEPTVPDHSP